jgi:hypothetical protein
MEGQQCTDFRCLSVDTTGWDDAFMDIERKASSFHA